MPGTGPGPGPATGAETGGAAAARAAAARAVAGWARELAGLVVPVSCAGCGWLDVALCRGCRDRLTRPAWRCEDGAARLDRLGRAPLPVWTVTAYTGPVREVVVAWKDRGRLDLTAPLAGALAGAAREVAPVLLAAGVGPLWVVPAPSSGAARRRRGADLVGALAGGVARGCRDAGQPAVVVRVLAQRRGARDQVGLSARDRRANLRGRVRRRRRVAVPAGQAVLLVDDVLTTGATLAACDDALRAAGARVVAGITLAATPAPGPEGRVEDQAARGYGGANTG